MAAKAAIVTHVTALIYFTRAPFHPCCEIARDHQALGEKNSSSAWALRAAARCSSSRDGLAMEIFVTHAERIDHDLAERGEIGFARRCRPPGEPDGAAWRRRCEPQQLDP